MSLFSRAKPARGITIIELLVILSVIAILAGLLFPFFGRAKNMSYQAQCAGNLRQLASAFTLYSSDWSGYWPCPGGLNPYVRQQGLRSVWCCPLLTEWHGRFPARSYTMNSYLREAPNGQCDIEYYSCVNFLSGIRVTRILQPHRTILLYEGIPRAKEFEDKAYTEDQIAYIYRCANWTWARGYYDKYTHTIDPGRPWHGRVNNYLYCDGHVIARPPGGKTSGTLSTYREMYEWYVDKAAFQCNYEKNWARLIPE